MMPIPCDIKIREDEKEEILLGKITIDDVISKYMKEISWTEKEFMRRGFEDYFSNKFNLEKSEIKCIISKLDLNKAFKNEMYMSIMNEEFPDKCWAKVDGLSASDYSKKLDTNLDDTYMYMIKQL